MLYNKFDLQGDGGDPILNSDGTQIGIVTGLAAPDYLTCGTSNVFTRVAPHVNWIRRMVTQRRYDNQKKCDFLTVVPIFVDLKEHIL